MRFVRLALLGAIALCWAWVAEAGIVAKWTFDRVEGDYAIDEVGGRRLRLHNVRLVDGAVGKAAFFAGRGDSFGSCPIDAKLIPRRAITVEAWVRPETVSENLEGAGIVATPASYVMRLTNGRPSFHIFTTNWAPALAFGVARPGQWYYLVGTYDGREQRIYVNGELAATVGRTGPINMREGTFFVGRQVNPFHGAIDQLCIYDEALSAEEISRRYQQAVAHNSELGGGTLREPFEDLFGQTRAQHLPPVTTKHLPRADVTFAVITDTHIGRPGEDHHYCHHWRVEEAIRQINALRPDFVVHLGDIITAHPYHDNYPAQCRHALEILSQLRVPIYYVAGNHDVGNQRPMRVWSQRHLQRRGLTLDDLLIRPDWLAQWRKMFGPDRRAWEAGGCLFFTFNDELCGSGWQEEQEQLRWLRKQLRRAGRNRLVFAFSHNPLFWRDPEEPDVGNYEPVYLPARRELLAIFREGGVDAVYTGHTHFAFSIEYAGMHLRTLNSTTFNRNFPGTGIRIPAWAQVYDPYKLGFLVVRVRGRAFHEAWVNLYRRPVRIPRAFERLLGRRLLPRPATEAADSALGVRVIVPVPHFEQKQVGGILRTFSLVHDHFWQLPAEIGCKWAQAYPAFADGGWPVEGLERALTLGRQRGVKLALWLPPDPDPALRWLKEEGLLEAVDALVVPNGRPENPKAPLSSWRAQGGPADWAAKLERVRRQAAGKKLVLARLALRSNPQALRAAAEAARGRCRAIAVWATASRQPEDALLEPLRQAASIARDAGLELWLDMAGWQSAEPQAQAAYFARAIALCHALGVRLFWWIGPDRKGGILDDNYDPTPMYFAAAAWNALASPAAEGAKIARRGQTVMATWRGADGRRYAAWWLAGDDYQRVEWLDVAQKVEVAVDTLTGREVRARSEGRWPCTAWPILARLAE